MGEAGWLNFASLDATCLLTIAEAKAWVGKKAQMFVRSCFVTIGDGHDLLCCFLVVCDGDRCCGAVRQVKI